MHWMNGRPAGYAGHDHRQVSLAAGHRTGRLRVCPVGTRHQAGVAERELRELDELPERRDTADRLRGLREAVFSPAKAGGAAIAPD